jgi:hypothetical protein
MSSASCSCPDLLVGQLAEVVVVAEPKNIPVRKGWEDQRLTSMLNTPLSTYGDIFQFLFDFKSRNDVIYISIYNL